MTSQWISLEQVDGARQSLTEFTGELTQENLVAFTIELHSLQETYVLFKEPEIRPVQCKEAIKSLQGVNEWVEKFYGLLKKTTDLPLVIIALRYELLVPLYRIEELVYELIKRIDNYRTICLTSSQYVIRQHQEICDAFERLLRLMTDTSQKFLLLKDEAENLENNLVSVLERELIF